MPSNSAQIVHPLRLLGYTIPMPVLALTACTIHQGKRVGCATQALVPCYPR